MRQQQQQEEAQQNPTVRFYTFKDAIVIGLTFLLSITMLTFEYLETRSEQEAKLKSIRMSFTTLQQAIKSSQPTDFHHLKEHAADTESSRVSAADAYWNQAVTLLQDWDPTLTTTTITTTSRTTETWNATHALQALQQAAELGHPIAQHWMANSHASGIWPTAGDDESSRLQVQDTFLESNNNKNQQQQSKAWLYWYMAAMAGHVEASMALATRMTKSSHSCPTRLPYYQAAAHGIMDALETSSQSRAKVAPPMDKHILYQINGESELDQASKKLWDLRLYYGPATMGDGQSPQAAFTLANWYHYGLQRGVAQNLTLALQHYELAAHSGHWEAAGQAGKFYLWGMGLEKPDPYKAHQMFNIGMPFGLEGCRRKHQEKLRQGQDSTESIYVCDHDCLNGMGILRLLGLPLVVSVDKEIAEKLFQLAKEQGNMDACYNLAMMKLGWKTHLKSREQHVEGEGQTLMNEQYFAVSGSNAYKNSPTQAEYESILTDLTTAAAKGHLQAKHRLAMMFADGVKIPWIDGQQVQAVPQDCDRALKHYKWIIDNASPQRSLRLREAYKQYIVGETSKSLRNYLAAAETGSDVAQLNAAFLLEQGECLGLNRTDCAKAWVRLWKEAARHGEASLRVGGFSSYGRFRKNDVGVVGPFGWFQYILYPQQYLTKLWSAFFG